MPELVRKYKLISGQFMTKKGIQSSLKTLVITAVDFAHFAKKVVFTQLSQKISGSPIFTHSPVLWGKKALPSYRQVFISVSGLLQSTCQLLTILVRYPFIILIVMYAPCLILGVSFCLSKHMTYSQQINCCTFQQFARQVHDTSSVTLSHFLLQENKVL